MPPTILSMLVKREAPREGSGDVIPEKAEGPSIAPSLGHPHFSDGERQMTTTSTTESADICKLQFY